MNDIKQFEPLWDVWKTEALIGEGSYGKVYRAVREEFGRKYYAAIKHISIPTSESQITEAISEGIADDNESVKEYFDDIAQSLINEITLMNDVKGKTNIVSYEDHLIIPKSSGVGYDIIIRMELLTGLNDILRHKQLTNKDVIKLGIDLCSALEVCVEKGIVHRDIKPSNIFVSDNGDYKLGDFGVARELEHTTSAMSKKGTYIYMAPEVYRGESANFSADIFSLGIVMYRLLNGNRAPFLPVSAKIKPGDNENALARRMAGEQIPAPAFAEEGLVQIILKATQFDRTKRYASPTEMKNDLIRLSGGTVMERTVPIIAEPTHNSASFQKRNVAEDQGTVILFPEQEETNQLYSNTTQSNQTAYVSQMPVRNLRPIAQPNNNGQSGVTSKNNGLRMPIIALISVLTIGLAVGGIITMFSSSKSDITDNEGNDISSNENDYDYFNDSTIQTTEWLGSEDNSSTTSQITNSTGILAAKSTTSTTAKLTSKSNSVSSVQITTITTTSTSKKSIIGSPSTKTTTTTTTAAKKLPDRYDINSVISQAKTYGQSKGLTYATGKTSTASWWLPTDEYNTSSRMVNEIKQRIVTGMGQNSSVSNFYITYQPCAGEKNNPDAYNDYYIILTLYRNNDDVPNAPDRYDVNSIVSQLKSYGKSRGLTYGKVGSYTSCPGIFTYEASYNEMLSRLQNAIDREMAEYPNINHFVVTCDKCNPQPYADYKDYLICVELYS